MSSRHGNSRRQAYGRRMKDLRSRRAADIEIDLEGPDGWNRGGAWEADGSLRGSGLDRDGRGSSVRTH